MNMFKKNGGFTLVELIVVIAILAILAGVAIPAYSGYIEKANATADITALAAVSTAAMANYATEGQVTKIVVTDGDSSDTISVWLNGDTAENEAKNPTSDEDFQTFMNSTTFSIELKTGTTATWLATESDTGADDAGWTIE